MLDLSSSLIRLFTALSPSLDNCEMQLFFIFVFISFNQKVSVPLCFSPSTIFPNPLSFADLQTLYLDANLQTTRHAFQLVKIRQT